MTPVAYLKLQAKNLFRDYKTKKPQLDKTSGGILYEYNPKYFDVDRILLEYDCDEDNFSLMKSQHLIACMAGFKKWTDLLKASDTELELAKLLFENQHKVSIEDWEMYIVSAEHDNNAIFSAEDRLEIFKHVFANVDGHESTFGDYRLPQAAAR